MAYSIQSSGQLVYVTKQETGLRQHKVDASQVVLERRELCSNSLFKQGSNDYFYYYTMSLPQGQVKWLVKVSSSTQHTRINHCHCYKAPAAIELVQDVQFDVHLVEERCTGDALV